MIPPFFSFLLLRYDETPKEIETELIGGSNNNRTLRYDETPKEIETLLLSST